MNKIPDEMTICNLEVLLLPNGELLCGGKTVAWFKDVKSFLSVKEKSSQASGDIK